ncbi:ESCRT-II complex subunit-domain-containing protein, partial [Pisolithus microcarpus]
MQLTTHTTPSGFRLPSIHAAHAFFTEQPNPTTQSVFTDNWTRLILSYARHRRLFVIRVEDAEVAGGDWDEILRNERINRRVLPSYLTSLISAMVSRNLAYYEPPKQTRSVILLWRLPEEWADVLHSWGTATGQLNTILTLYEITGPTCTFTAFGDTSFSLEAYNNYSHSLWTCTANRGCGWGRCTTAYRRKV